MSWNVLKKNILKKFWNFLKSIEERLEEKCLKNMLKRLETLWKTEKYLKKVLERFEASWKTSLRKMSQ